MINTDKLQTGTIILVSGNAPLSRAIQKFQCKADARSGIYNHSAIIFNSRHGQYVAEEAEVTGRKVKAASILTPFSHYLGGDYNLLALVPGVPIGEVRMEQIILKYLGVPYDYRSTFHDEIIRTLHDKWVGAGHERGWRRMNCHEFVQWIWHCYRPDAFLEYFKGDVADEFYSPLFNHERIK